MTLKMAVFAPMQSASVSTATKVNPGDLRSCRRANRRPFISFGTQSLNWIDKCGTPRRNQTREQRRKCQHDRGRAKQERIVWGNLVELGRDQTTDTKCSRETNDQTEDNWIHSLAYDQPQHVSCLCAQGHPHSNFASAF